jgi:hypothetical protein
VPADPSTHPSRSGRSSTADLGDAVLHVVPWVDPVVDELGHDPRSHYVEHYWLGVLGPSTTLLLRRLATAFDLQPEGFSIHLADTARSLGLGTRAGRNTPFLRALDRSCQFGMARRHRDVLEVRRRVPPLTRIHLAHLPESLQREHDEWQQESLRAPNPDEMRRRARRLALGLYQLGEDTPAVEHQLHEWRVHPAMAHDAVRWAQARLTSDAGSPAA